MLMIPKFAGLLLLAWAITFNVLILTGYADAYHVADMRAAVRVFGWIPLTIGFVAVHVARRLIDRAADSAATTQTALQGAGIALVSLGFIDRTVEIWKSGVAVLMVVPLAALLAAVAIQSWLTRPARRGQPSRDGPPMLGRALRTLGFGLAAGWAATLTAAGLVQFETAIRPPHESGLFLGACALLFFATGYLHYGVNLSRPAPQAARLVSVLGGALLAAVLLAHIGFDPEHSLVEPLGVVTASAVGVLLTVRDRPSAAGPAGTITPRSG